MHGRAKTATGRHHRLSASGPRNQAINCIETQYRKDADHAPRGGGQNGRPGAGCWSLPASPARANPALSIVDEYYPAFAAHLAEQGRELPGYVQREFEDYLKCGRLEHGFLRVRCESCHAERLVAFSCANSRRFSERRGFCPSCGARRMAESATLLVDEVLPEQPMRQWVFSVLYLLRFLFASRPKVMGRVLGIVYRCIATYLIKKAGFTRKTAQTGAVTLIQRFGSALTKSPRRFCRAIGFHRPAGCAGAEAARESYPAMRRSA